MQKTSLPINPPALPSPVRSETANKKAKKRHITVNVVYGEASLVDCMKKVITGKNV